MEGKMERMFCENPLQIDHILEKILNHVNSPSTLFKCRAINRFWNDKASPKALEKLDEMSVILKREDGISGDPTTSKIPKFLTYFKESDGGKYSLQFTNFTLKNIAIEHELTQEFLGVVGPTIKTMTIDWNDFTSDKEQDTIFLKFARGRAFEQMLLKCCNLKKLILESSPGSYMFETFGGAKVPSLKITDLEINYNSEKASFQFAWDLFYACSRIERLQLGDRMHGDHLDSFMFLPPHNTRWISNLQELTIVAIVGESTLTSMSVCPELKLKRVKLTLRFGGEYQPLARFLGGQKNTLEQIHFDILSDIENPMRPRISFPDPMPNLNRLHLECHDGAEFTPINVPIIFPSLEKLSVLGVGGLWQNVRAWMESSQPHLGVKNTKFQNVDNEGRILVKRLFPNSKIINL